jgi:hypothetical protein
MLGSACAAGRWLGFGLCMWPCFPACVRLFVTEGAQVEMHTVARWPEQSSCGLLGRGGGCFPPAGCVHDSAPARCVLCDGQVGATPLHLAVLLDGGDRIVDKLLEEGADCNEPRTVGGPRPPARPPVRVVVRLLRPRDEHAACDNAGL